MTLKSLLCAITLTLNLVVVSQKAVASDAPLLITLSPHLTEMVFDLDLEKQLVAVDESSNYPVEAKELPKIGSGLNPNQELLLLYQADILLSFASSPMLEKLVQTQDMELIISRPNSIADLISDWRNVLASAQQDPQKAAETENKIKKIEAKWLELQTEYATKTGKTIFFLISEKPLYSLSDKTFLSQAFKACNTQNIFATTNQPSFLVNPEELLIRQPELIIHGYNADDVDGKERSQQAVLELFEKLGLKIKKEQLISVNVDILHRPTMRFVKALPNICANIHNTQLN